MEHRIHFDNIPVQVRIHVRSEFYYSLLFSLDIRFSAIKDILTQSQREKEGNLVTHIMSWFKETRDTLFNFSIIAFPQNHQYK